MDETLEIADRIRDGMARDGARYSDRLPSERALCETYGATRHQVRRALRHLEEMGLIWRHVGRGTFVGARPVINLAEVRYLGKLVTAEQVIAARLSLEPEIAFLAAAHATPADLDRLRVCNQRCRDAVDWPEYEAWDNNIHHAVARASQNKLLLHFFETVNVLRRSAPRPMPHAGPRPAPDYVSFDQHEEIVSAIARGEGEGARRAMRAHLHSVSARLLP